jgi:hypothetical protein
MHCSVLPPGLVVTRSSVTPVIPELAVPNSERSRRGTLFANTIEQMRHSSSSRGESHPARDDCWGGAPKRRRIC